VHAAAHVTGGGIVENLPRVLPEGLEADVAWGSWPEPPVFELLRAQTGATEHDLRSTFNLGVGMVLVVPPALAERAIAHAGGSGSAAFPIGVVRA
jgi:phosphoribosylformylglycinamidine cyclo-ligase